MKFSICLLSFLVVFNLSLSAETSSEKKFCAKMKECALAQIPAEQRKMMEGMTDNMCKGVIAKMSEASSKHPSLASMLNKCIDSMSNLSCDKFLNEGGVETKECDALKAEAEKKGLDK